ncbi:MAG: hypothetical protein QOD73_971, partial [Solirubrobacteraceae bacterium]|nr:hypothetical protein [Solirubrobacteraceae bacterium]
MATALPLPLPDEVEHASFDPVPGPPPAARR